MNFVQISAEKRPLGSKGYLKSLRRNGSVPGILHGHNLDSTPVTIDAKDLLKAISTPAGRNVLLNLVIESDTQTAMIENLQEDILRENVYQHVDLKLISMDEKIEVNIPVLLTGQDQRANDDGYVSQQLHEISVMSKPAAIPENIKVDISALKIGDAILVGDISMPEGCEAVTAADEMIVNVLQPRTIVEDEPSDDEAETDQEPTLVGEESKEDN